MASSFLPELGTTSDFFEQKSAFVDGSVERETIDAQPKIDAEKPAGHDYVDVDTNYDNDYDEEGEEDENEHEVSPLPSRRSVRSSTAPSRSGLSRFAQSNLFSNDIQPVRTARAPLPPWASTSDTSDFDEHVNESGTHRSAPSTDTHSHPSFTQTTAGAYLNLSEQLPQMTPARMKKSCVQNVSRHIPENLTRATIAQRSRDRYGTVELALKAQAESETASQWTGELLREVRMCFSYSTFIPPVLRVEEQSESEGEAEPVDLGVDKRGWKRKPSTRTGSIGAGGRVKRKYQWKAGKSLAEQKRVRENSVAVEPRKQNLLVNGNVSMVQKSVDEAVKMKRTRGETGVNPIKGIKKNGRPRKKRGAYLRNSALSKERVDSDSEEEEDDMMASGADGVGMGSRDGFESVSNSATIEASIISPDVVSAPVFN